MGKLKAVAVNYLNTKPLLYGLFKKGMDEWMEIQLEIPSVCAKKLEAGTVDFGLVPVAVIPELSTPHIVSDYCIGSERAVKTVCIYSETPLEEVKEIYLDYHSRTSVALTKLLLKNYWQLAPVLRLAKPGFEKEIKGRSAALIIGDRTIGLEEQYDFVYDLGSAWYQYSGLPFVFAAWVSNRPLSPQFITAFNDAISTGLKALPQLMYLLPSPHPAFNLQEYFTQNISYDLDHNKRKALSRFLTEIKANPAPTFEKSLWPAL